MPMAFNSSITTKFDQSWNNSNSIWIWCLVKIIGKLSCNDAIIDARYEEESQWVIGEGMSSFVPYKYELVAR